MLLSFRKNRWNFESENFCESAEDCVNPGRGWYRLFSMDASLSAPLKTWKYCQAKEEQLALLMVDIGAYAGDEISLGAIRHIRQALDFFRDEKKELLLRFVYDREGKGLEREPVGDRRIRQHMEQLAPLLKEYEDEIFCLQGLFVGSWGEMHGSRFLTEKSLPMLWQTLYKAAPSNCFFAVRRPDQWKMVTGISGESRRLGLFNDGLLGSSTDLGTFEEKEREESLRFQDELGLKAPNGGESVGEDACGEIENAVAHFRKLHISYLSSVHDDKVLSRWKNSSYKGENAYDYIGRHLGYRFVVKNAVLVGKGKKQLMEVELENSGFAPLYTNCRPILYSVNGKDVSMLSAAKEDLRELMPGKRLKLRFDLEDAAPGEVALCIRQRKTGRYIRTANEGAGDYCKIGVLEAGL